MSNNGRRVAVIGMDALMPGLVEKFVSEGRMPNFARLMSQGVYSHALASMPNETGANWATISTGAEPGTHGCFFWVHLPGKPLDQLESGFISTACQAERIWQAAEKSGKKTILFDYPGSKPLNIENVIHVGEYGHPDFSDLEIAFCMVYSTEQPPDIDPARIKRHKGRIEPFTHIPLKPADGWHGLPESHQIPLETEMIIDQKSMGGKTKGPGRPPLVVHALAYDSSGNGYDRILLSLNKDAASSICTIETGAWSPFVTLNFEVNGREVSAGCRFKLLELSPRGDRLRLYRSQVYPVDGFTYPGSIAKELVSECGPYLHRSYDLHAYWNGWCDKETFLEENRSHALWYGRAAKYLLGKYDWDLFMMKWHGPDMLCHALFELVDPVNPRYDPDKASEGLDYFAEFYSFGDKILGEIMEIADENTVIMVVSDHGHISNVGRFIDLDRVFERAGLLSKLPDGTIDWDKTKVFRGYVNLRGREPQGIVPPEEYDLVREKMIEALLDIKDPLTGKRPVKFALKKEDAIVFGLGGDRERDVVFALDPLEPLCSFGGVALTEDGDDGVIINRPQEGVAGIWSAFSAGHGQYFPTSRLSLGSMEALFIMAGPGIKKGYRRKNPVWLHDVAPTISWLMGMRPPVQSEGRVITDALEI